MPEATISKSHESLNSSLFNIPRHIQVGRYSLPFPLGEGEPQLTSNGLPQCSWDQDRTLEDKGSTKSEAACPSPSLPFTSSLEQCNSSPSSTKWTSSVFTLPSTLYPQVRSSCLWWEALPLSSPVDVLWSPRGMARKEFLGCFWCKKVYLLQQRDRTHGRKSSTGMVRSDRLYAFKFVEGEEDTLSL